MESKHTSINTMHLFAVLCSSLFATSLFSYVDSDFDGVEDSLDKCSATAFTDLVDEQGCTVKTLESLYFFDILLGYDSPSTGESFQSLQADFYYKNFSASLSSSYSKKNALSINDKELNDFFVGTFYQFIPVNNFNIKVGMGAIIPTSTGILNNNKIDYISFLSLNYIKDKYNFFTDFSYAFINDTNTTQIAYQNTFSISPGVGYFFNDSLYGSLSYYKGQSIYKNTDAITSTSLYFNYTINAHWFTTLSYTYDLGKNATNIASIRVGYFF